LTQEASSNEPVICDLPSSVSLQVTESCNLRCKMCYEWGETGRYSMAGGNKKPASLDISVLKKVIRELAPARPSYDLFGGEPLVYPHLEELIVAVKEAGSALDTPTNGTLLKKHAAMLVRTGFDSVRVSLDGTQEINDTQRGPNSYARAMAGIEALHREKQKAASRLPIVSIIFTVTAENYLSLEQFFLRELDLEMVEWVTIQMQNFVTESMGKAYARMLQSEFGLTGDRYWRGLVRATTDFEEIDCQELARQVKNVSAVLRDSGKGVLLLPPTFSAENLSAYLGAQWNKMTDTYRQCAVPWNVADITATGDVAPCHVFYDLVMGNIDERPFSEIWNGPAYQSFRRRMSRHGLMSVCPGCCILYIAGS
jgi:radical SAM protein with 4Fe4S-binding SPASM domain